MVRSAMVGDFELNLLLLYSMVKKFPYSFDNGSGISSQSQITHRIMVNG